MKTRIKIIIPIVAFILVLVFVKFSDRNLDDFKMTEDAKGTWVLVEDFRKEIKRYPEDTEELIKHYKLAGQVPFTYVKPTDDNKDETIIIWKEKTSSGETIEVLETGQVKKN